MRTLPQPDAALVDPATGRIERVWMDFFRDQSNQISGGTDQRAVQTLPVIQDQAALAFLADNLEPDLTAITAAISDLTTLAVLALEPDGTSIDQAALFGLVIAD